MTSRSAIASDQTAARLRADSRYSSNKAWPPPAKPADNSTAGAGMAAVLSTRNPSASDAAARSVPCATKSLASTVCPRQRARPTTRRPGNTRRISSISSRSLPCPASRSIAKFAGTARPAPASAEAVRTGVSAGRKGPSILASRLIHVPRRRPRCEQRVFSHEPANARPPGS